MYTTPKNTSRRDGIIKEILLLLNLIMIYLCVCLTRVWSLSSIKWILVSKTKWLPDCLPTSYWPSTVNLGGFKKEQELRYVFKVMERSWCVKSCLHMGTQFVYL